MSLPDNVRAALMKRIQTVPTSGSCEEILAAIEPILAVMWEVASDLRDTLKAFEHTPPRDREVAWAIALSQGGICQDMRDDLARLDALLEAR